MDQSKMKVVYVISSRGERRYWNRVGVAFVNSDGSINCTLGVCLCDEAKGRPLNVTPPEIEGIQVILDGEDGHPLIHGGHGYLGDEDSVDAREFEFAVEQAE